MAQFPHHGRNLGSMVPLFALAAGVLACDTHDDTVPASLADVVFAAGANDESLVELLAATPIDGQGQGAVMDLPTEGTQLSRALAPTFAWHAGPTARARPPLLYQLVQWFGIPEAHAHGVAVSGKAYFLVVSSSSDPQLLRVFTKETTYQPSAAAWAKIKAAGGSLTVVVTSAQFDTGKITSNGGPFLGKPVHFGVAP